MGNVLWRMINAVRPFLNIYTYIYIYTNSPRNAWLQVASDIYSGIAIFCLINLINQVIVLAGNAIVCT